MYKNNNNKKNNNYQKPKTKKVTLKGKNGRSIIFEVDGEVEYDDELYYIMHPLDKTLLEDGQAMVFKVIEDNYILVDDDELIDTIGEIYNNEE
jgi:hypothetical protein